MNVPRILLALNLILALALAGTLLAQPQEALFGTWKTIVAKSKYSPEDAPKSAVNKYEVTTDGFRLTGDNVTATGAVQHAEVNAKFDGKNYPVKGNPDADMYAFKKINGRTYELVQMKGGKQTTTIRIVVAPDGKSRMNTVTAKNAKGQAVNDSVYSERQ